MTNEQLYELLENIDDKYIRVAKAGQNFTVAEGNRTKKKSLKEKIRRFNISTTVAAVFALCIFLTGATVFATSEKVQGFFKNVINFTGAVTGQIYEQATDEVEILVSEISDNLTVEVRLIQKEVVPYSTFTVLGVETYEITDMDEKVIKKGKTTKMVEIENGIVSIPISIDDISKGTYKLVISELVGSSKADQPCVLTGEWECEFSIE